jgi:hypothetical protein
MFSHLALVPGILIAVSRLPPLLELVVLQTIVVVLSLIWHRNHERECGLAKVEHLFAHALFVYGLVQTWFAPTIWVFAIDALCACVTLGTYVATSASPELWEVWHPIGLHVFPGLWSISIATFNDSLLEML